jgi:glycosyltransferase involved in cell wall biosynthesis
MKRVSSKPKKRYTIGINALFLVPNRVGGTEYHLRSFLKELDHADSEFTFIVFCNQENADTFSFAHKNWKKVVCPVPAKYRALRILYEQFLLPQRARGENCDLLHSFGYFGPLYTAMPHVVTVHDVNWKDHPEDSSRFTNLLLRLLCEQGMKTAAKIMTVSQFSAQRIQHYFPHLSAKIAVIPSGVDQLFNKSSKYLQSKVAEKKQLLCVSSFYPHKRVLYLLDLWEVLQPRLPGYQLVIVGQNGLDMPAVLKRIAELSNVTHYHKVSFTILHQLYYSAAAVIQPSVYEGFGYPVYEARALNKKVVVGARKLYDEKMQNQLSELSFNPKKDALMIESLLQSTKKYTPFTLSYKTAIRRLEQLYREVPQ